MVKLLDMTKLGFEEPQLGDFKESIHKPFGMVLVTGPTGSGKSTTLYASLARIVSDAVKAITAGVCRERMRPDRQSEERRSVEVPNQVCPS